MFAPVAHRVRWPSSFPAATVPVYLNKILCTPGVVCGKITPRQFADAPGAASGFVPAPGLLSLIPRVVRHSGNSVQYLSATDSSYNILNIDRNMWCCPAATAPLSWANQYGGGEHRHPSGCSPAHSAPGKTALSEKMSKFFFGDRNYCDRTAPRFTPYFRCAAMCPG